MDNLEKAKKAWLECEIMPWQVEGEFIPFLKFIMDNGIINILEIGAHKGGSAEAFLRIGCRVTSIDIVKQPEIERLEKHSNFGFFLRNQFFAEGYDRYDLLWIDGDHSYEACLEDYYAFKNFVRHGGYIAFHDIVDSELHKNQNCGVHRAIETIMKDYPIFTRLDIITDGVWGGITILYMEEK